MTRLSPVHMLPLALLLSGTRPSFGQTDTPTAPEGFTSFSFAGHEDGAKILSEYLWYHFDHRLGNGKTLFNKEYLTIADPWLGGAIDKRRKKSIQEVHREDLLAIRQDDEGYIHTHQHFSHAHEHGWPFPLWTQSGPGPDQVKGITAGWHFQPDGPGWMWVWNYIKGWQRPEYFGKTATKGWDLIHCKSLGLVENKWRIEATGPSPAIVTPEGMAIDAFNAPFLQLRWKRTGQALRHALPYIEWLREGDADFGPDRRVYMHSQPEDHTGVTGCTHTMITMYRHPLWTGKIKRMKLVLAPGESDVTFDIDCFFTVYDTRHAINNPIFILASWNYFRWTGDLDFLRRNLDRMRFALRYQMTEMGGVENSFILNRWPGHDGLPGWVRNPDGSKTVHPGHGVGNNYYDIMPFGWKDTYSTMQYYASLRVMADIEAAVRARPGWSLPLGAMALDPDELRRHAEAVKATGNRVFWNEKTGRYVACIDKDGHAHDYGYPWLGQEAIWYGFATPEHARAIMDWVDGRRIIEGDTSTGADIYHWRFGPRVSTLRNIDWYGQGWTGPETIPWGGQVQDGGAVLGFAFYDLWARLKTLGPDDAWKRLNAIIDWERAVRSAGGYRAFYADGKQGTTLQGGGTAGGIGIDAEFFESSMIPAIVVLGFLGLDPAADTLRINPALPAACPAITARNLLYHNTRLTITAEPDRITVTLHDHPIDPIRLTPATGWKLEGSPSSAEPITLPKPGTYILTR